LRHPDPEAAIAKNVYACALFDSYVPDILFGEVLLKPDWQQATLSAQEIRLQTGIPPAPVALIPPSFTVQLYNPPQQVEISEKRASFGADSYWFEMPQWTFREPSGSAIDKGSNDPTADPTTPFLRFVWKKEGSLSKDLTCYLTGKSTDNKSKKKGGKEPDIAIAKLENYRDLAIYESNFNRVDVQDQSGLEYVLLLSAATIRDVYCGQRKDAFNTGGTAHKKPSGGFLGRKKSTPALNSNNASNVPPIIPTIVNNKPNAYGSGPPPDPRAKWEIDAEQNRLQQQQELERAAAEARRRERERIDAEEAARLQKEMDREEKERRKKQQQVDKETAKLLKKYGNQSDLFANRPQAPPLIPPRQPYQPQYQYQAAQSQMNLGGPPQWAQQARPPIPPRPANQAFLSPPQQPQAQPKPQSSSSPYGNIAASMSSFFHGKPTAPRTKKNTSGTRRLSDAGQPQAKLNKKRSSVW
jgi:hypothetical protein